PSELMVIVRCCWLLQLLTGLSVKLTGGAGSDAAIPRGLKRMNDWPPLAVRTLFELPTQVRSTSSSSMAAGGAASDAAVSSMKAIQPVVHADAAPHAVGKAPVVSA